MSFLGVIPSFHVHQQENTPGFGRSFGGRSKPCTPSEHQNRFKWIFIHPKMARHRFCPMAIGTFFRRARNRARWLRIQLAGSVPKSASSTPGAPNSFWGSEGMGERLGRGYMGSSQKGNPQKLIIASFWHPFRTTPKQSSSKQGIYMEVLKMKPFLVGGFWETKGNNNVSVLL